MNYEDELKFEALDDMSEGMYRLKWVERGGHYISDMIVSTIIGELGKGTITELAKRSISDLYTCSGVARITEEVSGNPALSSSAAVIALRNQVAESLNISGDYYMIRTAYFETLKKYYVVNSTSSEERLIDDTTFEISLQLYMLIRVLRDVIDRNRTHIEVAMGKMMSTVDSKDK